MNTIRKMTRFYIVNPITDRRTEQRFSSKESVVVKIEENSKVFPAIAFDVGRSGLRLEAWGEVVVGSYLQISFPNSPEHIRCFGQIVWSKRVDGKDYFIFGVSIGAWHGVVSGENSWKKYKGSNIQSDRRSRIR
ncbi:MAG: PilZ domain-containing protein [Elusimicrobiota bacterium]